MLKRIAALSAVLFALLTAETARAQTVRVTLGPDAQQVADRLMITNAQLRDLIETQIRGLFGLVDAPTFLRLSANAQSMANKGLGAEYASDFDRFLIGFALNVAVAAGNTDIASLKDGALGDFDRAVPVAAGLQLGAIVGFKLTDGLYLYANGLAYPASYNGLSGSGYNVGGHLQYRLGSGLGSKLAVEWGGIAITGGLEVSRTTFTLDQTTDNGAPLAKDLQVLASSHGQLELVQKALTIPFELTTSLRFLYLVTIYAGGGLDVQLGSASANLALDSTLTGEASNKQRFDLGTARIEYAGENDADKIMFRLLAGLSINVGPLRVFTQLNVLTRDLTVSLAAGLRLAF